MKNVEFESHPSRRHHTPLYPSQKACSSPQVVQSCIFRSFTILQAKRPWFSHFMIQRSVVVVHRCLDGCDVEHSGYRDGVRVFVSFSQDRNRLISSISMILDFAYSSRAFIASDSVLQGDLLASVADDTGFDYFQTLIDENH